MSNEETDQGCGEEYSGTDAFELEPIDLLLIQRRDVSGSAGALGDGTFSLYLQHVGCGQYVHYHFDPIDAPLSFWECDCGYRLEERDAQNLALGKFKTVFQTVVYDCRDLKTALPLKLREISSRGQAYLSLRQATPCEVRAARLIWLQKFRAKS